MMNADEFIFIYANELVLLETRVLSTLNMLYRTFTYVMNVDDLIFICTQMYFSYLVPFPVGKCNLGPVLLRLKD